MTFIYLSTFDVVDFYMWECSLILNILTIFLLDLFIKLQHWQQMTLLKLTEIIFKYISQVLKFNLTESGLFCVLPWLTMAISANFGGWIADTLVTRGVSVTRVRKVSPFNFFSFSFLVFLVAYSCQNSSLVLCSLCR